MTTGKTNFVITPPAVELLLSEGATDSPWKKEIQDNQELQVHAKMRQNVHEKLTTLFKRIPHITLNISEALELGFVNSEETATIYNLLADFLESDTSHRRIILYFPFELLPDPVWQTSSKELRAAATRFTNAYLKCWEEMLRERDVRANFVDGDIMDPELGGGIPPRIVKAAHFIPELVKREYISTPWVITLLENSSDETLRTSIADTLPILADMSLLPRTEWRRMLFSSNPVLRTSAFATTHALETKHPLDSEEYHRFLELLNPKSYPHESRNMIYENIEEVLRAASEMMLQNVVSPEYEKRISEALIAAIQFWSMNYTCTKIAVKLAEVIPSSPMSLIAKDYTLFKQHCSSSHVQKWTHLWGDEMEVMEPIQAWKKLFLDRQYERDALVADNIHEEDPDGLLRRIAREITAEINRIEEKYTPRQLERIAEARIDWERYECQKRAVLKYSDILATILINTSISPCSLQEFLIQTREEAYTLVVIRGIGKAVEMLFQSNPEEAQMLRNTYEHILDELWQDEKENIQDALVSIWSRWESLGAVDCSYRTQYGIEISVLDPSFSFSITRMVDAEAQEVLSIVQSAARNPELSHFIYPVALLFGSRLKGYAKRNADLDVAVFIRPDIPIEKRPEIRKLLAQIFLHKKIKGKILEFWLARDEDRLQVRDIPDSDTSIAASTWVHILFAGVWCGERKTIAELHEKLLSAYLFSHRKEIQGHEARRIWLGEIEREVLQYRLMHKGYLLHHVEQGGIHTPHSDRIDSESTFWDSGYRRLATTLFIGRVFLPQLEYA